VIAPDVNDADRNVDFGMDHALSCKVLHHAPGGQLVVFRVKQQPGNGFKGVHEPGEVLEMVNGLSLGKCEQIGVVPGA